MLIQILLGTGLLLVSILVAGLTFYAMETSFARLEGWLSRPPHRPKLMLSLCIATIWIMAQVTIGVWVWALTFQSLGIFPTLEESVYFALVAFTTLGFGDVLLPADWRLLSGMAAANGLLNFGLVTAFIVEAMRQIRTQQRDFLA